MSQYMFTIEVFSKGIFVLTVIKTFLEFIFFKMLIYWKKIRELLSQCRNVCILNLTLNTSKGNGEKSTVQFLSVLWENRIRK